jgi:hypothetical protein
MCDLNQDNISQNARKYTSRKKVGLNFMVTRKKALDVWPILHNR